MSRAYARRVSDAGGHALPGADHRTRAAGSRPGGGRVHGESVQRTATARPSRTIAPCAALELGPSDTVLDAGCGTGQHLDDLLAVAGGVIAVDHSARSVEIAAGRIGGAGSRSRQLSRCGPPQPPARRRGGRRGPLGGGASAHPDRGATTGGAPRAAPRPAPGGPIAVVVYRWLGHIRRHKEGYFPVGSTATRSRRASSGGRSARRASATSASAASSLAPSFAQRLGVGVAAQRRLVHNPLARPFAHYLLATAIG